MSAYVAIFWLLAVAVLLAAWRYGGRDERLITAIYIVSALVTVAVRPPLHERYFYPEWRVFAVDVVTLIALLIAALRARAWWPAWVVALHALSTLAHVARVLNPGFLRMAYDAMAGAASYPILLTISFGIWSYRRRALQRARSWSSFSSRAERRLRN